MTPADFLPWIETELVKWGEPFDWAALAEWVRCMWPHIQEDPDPYRWAGEFLEARRAVAT
jgi:hypothetical protein